MRSGTWITSVLVMKDDEFSIRFVLPYVGDGISAVTGGDIKEEGKKRNKKRFRRETKGQKKDKYERTESGDGNDLRRTKQVEGRATRSAAKIPTT
ncbi:hypothetical protein V6N11_045261 [Hibiscus sabdariffa]|uniref:Uncharacterized protein n=1 Tax=Hibiscus sabdariffa TaxID=183260 RepID=A0ABR2Q0F7_9ROSI